MNDGLTDYEAILSRLPGADIDTLLNFLADELPYEWAGLYRQLSRHQTNILRIKIGTFEYLFDYASELAELR